MLVHRTVTTDYITLTDRKSNENLREYLEEQINENLIQAVLSAGRNKDGISKIKIRPIRLKGQICYQASATEGQKVLHKTTGVRN